MQQLSTPLPVPPPRVDFKSLYEQEFDYVARSLRRLGARESELKDLCQEVFLAAFDRRATYDVSRPVRPWLFGIAFRALSELRSRAWQRREVVGQELAAEPQAAPHVEEAVVAREARDVVLAALQKLPDERRAVLIMHDLDGAAAPQISEALGIPLNTVYSRLRVGRAELTAAVKRLLPDGGLA